MKSSNRTTLLLLSGGLDSTTCLFNLLRETDDEIHTIYVDVENNNIKSWCETNALNNIIPIARKIRNFEHSKSIKIDISRGEAVGIQSMLWMLSAAMTMNTLSGTSRRLCLGYTMGDSELEYGNSSSNWKYIWSQVGAKKKLPSLYMPLAEKTKAQSIDYLLKQEELLSEGIIKYIWTCEEPELIHYTSYSGYRVCGKCKPCTRRKEWTTSTLSKCSF